MKKISSFISHFSSQKGFTLVELLMSMGLMTVILGVLTGIFGSIIDVSLESRSASAIDQDGRYITARLAYDMQRSSGIIAPSAPSAVTGPTLTITIDSVDYTYGLDGSGNFTLTNDFGTNNLNSSTVEVENLTFQRIGIGDATDTVQIKFDLTSRIRRTSGFETKSIQTTLGNQ